MLQCIINNNSMPLNKSCTFQKEMFTSFTGLGFELWITVHWSWSWPDKTNTCNNFFITLNKSRTHSKFSLFYVFSSSLIASLHLSVKCPKDESSRVNMMPFLCLSFPAAYSEFRHKTQWPRFGEERTYRSDHVQQ